MPRIFLLLLMLASLPGRASTDSTEKVFIPFREYRMATYVYRPKTASPSVPVVIFSHGRAGTAEGRARVEMPESGMIDFWLAQGFAVVAPVRPGYGETGGGDREVHGARWVRGADGALVCEGRADFLTVAEKSAQAVTEVVKWTQSQAWADGKRVLLVGQSVGGLTTVALTTKALDGVVGAINFAGGTGGDPQGSPGRSCMPDVMTALYRDYGTKAGIPSLWLYSRNDQYWGETSPVAWHAAFAAGGSDTRFVQAPAISGHDGHQLLRYGQAYWIPEVEAFLRKLGLATSRP